MNQFIPNQKVLNFQLSRQKRVINADLKARGLHKSARELFLFLWGCAHTYKPNGKPLCPKGLIFKIETLAEHMEVCDRTIQRNIRLLAGLGLLRVESNKSPRRGGSPTNKLWPVWEPQAATVPEPEKRTAPSDVPVDRATHQSERFTMEPESVFVWPAVSPSTPTPCHPGEGDESRIAPSFARTFAEAREKDLTYSMSEQPIPDGPAYAFESAEALRLFLISQLQTHGIHASTIDQWIVQYGLARVAQVAHWVFADKVSSIQQVGGWMRRALDQRWSAPKAIAEARAKAIAQVKIRQRKQEELARENAKKVQADAVEAERESVWNAIVSHLAELPELYTLAEGNARRATSMVDGSLNHEAFRIVFRAGSPGWKKHLIDAALERPDLWRAVAEPSSVA